MRYRPATFDELIRFYKQQIYSLRQLITYAKSDFKDDVINRTAFLDDSCDAIERLYYVINDIHEQVKCKICGKPASWSGRINEGYHDTCGDKACISAFLNNIKTGSTKISENRDNAFIEEQSKIFNVNDDVIKNLIKYDRQVELLTNTAIIYYLDQRFSDSYSRLETFQRIKQGIEEKPKCPTCGKPVRWVGKKNKMFTTYCCDKCAASSKEVKEKKAQAQLDNWGERCCYNSEKYKQQCKEKYGVEYHSQRKEIKEKRKKTLIEHYGTTKLFSIEAIRNKIKATNRKKYGCDAYFQSIECRKKINEVCHNNSKFGTSKAEDIIYAYLIELGYEVERSYFTEDFPYKCDFYLKELDLRIEYNGSQYHNGRAFLNTIEDKKEVEALIEKDEQLCKEKKCNKTQYASIIKTWTTFDVKKREEALEKKIPYLEIYDCKSKEDLDYQISFYLCCRNKINLYSFDEQTLQTDFNIFKNLCEKDLYDAVRSNNRIVKQFQCCNFFKHEMELYAENPIIRRKLIQNRMKYLNKNETELTPDELITGFKKSGIYYGYSHFNPRWTNWFVNAYNIKTVYDPCGGWGHHLLGMLQCDKIIYNDFSQLTVDSIREMKDYFEIDNLEIHYGDAAEYVPADVDAFFMCPPYFNLEHYECGDFDDIRAYEKFLNEIFNIWHKNTAKVFGVIIREDLLQYIKDKPTDVFELRCTKPVHLNETKKAKEKFYIFKKA